MPEQSHLAEMRETIKADRERAAKRERSVPLPIELPAAAPVTQERAGMLERLRRLLLGR